MDYGRPDYSAQVQFDGARGFPLRGLRAREPSVPMSVFQQDLTIEQGATFALTTDVYQIAGVTQDFTGAHCRMMLRVAPTDVSPVLSLTDTASANGSVIPNGAAGTVTISITPAGATSVPAVQPYQYDLYVDLLNGASVRLMAGRAFIAAAITH